MTELGKAFKNGIEKFKSRKFDEAIIYFNEAAELCNWPNSDVYFWLARVRSFN